MPAPPYSSSTVMPCSPSAPISGHSSIGKRSVRSISAATGAILSSAKSRTVLRSMSISGPRSWSSIAKRVFCILSYIAIARPFASPGAVRLVVDRGVDDAVGPDEAAIHAGAVERQCQCAILAHGNEAAGAADPAEFGDDRAGRLRQRVAAMTDARRDFVRDGEADEELAAAGRRDRAGGVVGECAGAEDRAVPDPSRQFAGQPAGRGRGAKIPATIARNSADSAVAARVVFVPIVRNTPRAPGQGLLQRHPP